ncbi:hypothetical protein [Sphingomonas oryzagri]
MARDFDAEIAKARAEIAAATDDLTRADAMRRGGIVVREWIKAEAYPRALRAARLSQN